MRPLTSVSLISCLQPWFHVSDTNQDANNTPPLEWGCWSCVIHHSALLSGIPNDPGRVGIQLPLKRAQIKQPASLCILCL